jgi:hypothetical protein
MLLDDDEAERKREPLRVWGARVFVTLSCFTHSHTHTHTHTHTLIGAVRAKQDDKRVVDEKRAKERAERTEARRLEKAKRALDDPTPKAPKKPRSSAKKQAAAAAAGGAQGTLGEVNTPAAGQPHQPNASLLASLLSTPP